MIPDKIYYHKGALNSSRVEDDDIEYLRKDALLEKVNRARELRIKSGAKESSDGIGVIDALIDLINKL